MRFGILLLAGVFGSLNLLFSNVFAEETANVARLRVFKDAAITLFPGTYCYGGNNPAAIEASDGPPSIFSLNKKIGMPLTDDMPEGYNEYFIEANKPMTVMLKWEAVKDGVKVSCGPIGSTFYPEYGKNYDVTVAYSAGCVVQVRELYDIAPGRAGAKPAPSGYAYPCASQ